VSDMDEARDQHFANYDWDTPGDPLNHAFDAGWRAALASRETTPDTEFHDEETLRKVHTAIRRSTGDPKVAESAINNMQNAGILFRERGPVDAVQGDAELLQNSAPQEPTDEYTRETLVREVSLAHAAAWSDALECAEAPDRIADAVLSWLHASGWRKATDTTDQDVREALARVLRGATDDGANRTEDMADAILARFRVTPKEEQ